METKDKIRELVFIALGEVSVCWSTPQGAGVFQSDKAVIIGNKLIKDLAYTLEDSALSDNLNSDD